MEAILENKVSKTGDKVWINDVQYTVVKMGDCSGDGSVDIIDMALIKRDILDSQKVRRRLSQGCQSRNKYRWRNRYNRYGIY